MAPVLKQITSPDDLRSATDLQTQVFLGEDEPLHALIFPTSNPATNDDIARIAASITSKQATERDAGAESVYWAALDDSDGAFMAGARWVFYPQGSTHQYTMPVITRPDVPVAHDDDARARLAYVQWALTKYYALRVNQSKGPHAMLELCYTSKSHRRKGAGRLLVDAGVRRADELGIPCYVEAVGDGAKLYEKSGFRIVQTVSAIPEGGSWEGRPGWNGYTFQWMKRAANSTQN